MFICRTPIVKYATRIALKYLIKKQRRCFPNALHATKHRNKFGYYRRLRIIRGLLKKFAMAAEQPVTMPRKTTLLGRLKKREKQ
jgi:tellurite resistance-related uncharacterized protein